jgi:hypothetical protein
VVPTGARLMVAGSARERDQMHCSRIGVFQDGNLLVMIHPAVACFVSHALRASRVPLWY